MTVWKAVVCDTVCVPCRAVLCFAAGVPWAGWCLLRSSPLRRVLLEQASTREWPWVGAAACHNLCQQDTVA